MRRHLLVAVGLALAAQALAENVIRFDTPTSSSYDSPWSRGEDDEDREWENLSLPIGNGSIGASVLGAVGRERIVLNEKTLWSGGPATGAERYWRMNRTVRPEVLDSVRAYLRRGMNMEADSMVRRNFNGTIPYTDEIYGAFNVLGEALVSTGANEASVCDYRRELDIDSAIVRVSFVSDGVAFEREYFASYPDSVMVFHFSSSEPSDLTFRLNIPHAVDEVADNGGIMVCRGHLENNGLKWAVAVGVRSDGSVAMFPGDGMIKARGKSVEFIVSADTDYRLNKNPDFRDPEAYVGADPAPLVTANVWRAMNKSFGQLYAAHLADYQALYGRVTLALNPGRTEVALSTPERLAAYRAGAEDSGLEETVFQYGRYLLISSSRPGNLPANLQGIWHNNIDGPWHVDYHNNINVQMNYWPATVANLAECFAPFADYVESLQKPGELTARAYYGAPGWTAGISANAYGFTAPLIDEDMTWNYNPAAGPWLATQLWDFYDFTRDDAWLRDTAYPLIKGAADFAVALLVDGEGGLTSSPSYSPEHGGCSAGATYANAVTREILDNAVAAATVLGVDEDAVDRWADALDAIAPYRVGQYGQLQEWADDIDDPNDHHRHTNHLFGLHPGHSIDASSDTELADACRTTLNQRGDHATGWAMGWKLNHWARLLDGDRAYVLLRNLLCEGMADNLWDMHPPFQIDGNFGATAGIAEMLLQSGNGVVTLLPALPEAWKNGSVRGLRARGNFEVDIVFADGALVMAEVRSLGGEMLKLRYDGQELQVPTDKGRTYRFTVDHDRLRLIEG